MKYFREFEKSHPYFKVTLNLILILLFFMVMMGFYFPNGAINGYSSFILAFEFAQTHQDIQLLFEGLPVEEIKNIDTGNYFDFGYMVCYSFLLGYLFVKSAKIFEKKWLWIGIPLVILIFSGDFFENIILLKITNLYISGLNESILIPLLQKLHIITWIKWGGLAFAFFIFYEVLYRLNWFYKISGVICLFPFLYILAAGEFTPKEITIFTYYIIVAFFVLIVFGLSYSTKKDDVLKGL